MTEALSPETPSTVLSSDQPVDGLGGGTPTTLDPENKEPETLREVLKTAMKADKDGDEPKPDDAVKVEDKKDAKADKEAEKPDAKAEKEPKDDKPPKEEKPVKVDDQPKDTPEQDEKPLEAEKPATKPEPGKPNRDAAPESFHPDAKEVWVNTPRAVRRDLHSYIEKTTSELEQAREYTQRYEQVRDFDEYLTQNGGSLRESLTRVARLETLLQTNPLAGINEILLEAGPRKPDGSPVTLMEMARTIVQMGEQGYNQAISQARQQPQVNPQDQQIQALQTQIQEMQQQQMAASVIEPFKAQHPRYDELKNDIAFFLKSGKIAGNLSPAERLEVAYDMAERINAASTSANQAEPADPASNDRAPSFDGSKSVKSSPGAVSENDTSPAEGSIRDLLRSNIKKAGRS